MSTYVDMTDLDDEFKHAQGSLSGVGVPDGIYEARIEQVGFEYARSGNERLFRWIFETTDTGQKIRKTHLIRKELLHWLKKDLERCGWKPQSLTEIQQKCRPLLVGLTVKLRVETKETKGEPRQNVYIEKCFDPLPDDQNEPPPPNDADMRQPGEDDPF